MKIFLVRHAEGKEAVEKWQSPGTHLSDQGKRQAEALGSLPRFKVVEKIISSDWKRSIETAEIASKSLGMQVEVRNNIEERHQSTKIYGLSRADKISEEYNYESIKNGRDWDWKWDAEEESFNEVLKRALKFKNYMMSNYLQKNILIFSHESFIRLFISVCIFGDSGQHDYFKQFYRSTAIEPTGISLLIFREESKIWKLWYLNDYSHLASVKP
ncbi:histidine phosphatase family protein [Candidatus Amesbacteria bacterium]|nr:histidine phosphatase family protein [Candidatus Amesbacteria bacterium]